MTAFYSAKTSPKISRNVAGEAVARALRSFVGVGRDMSVKELEAQSGVSARLIECALCHPETTDYRSLKQESLLSIASVLGPSFTTELLKPIQQAAYRCDKREVEPGVLAADCATDTAEVVCRAADGHFDINDRRALKLVGQRHVERGMLLVAMGA